MKPTVSIWQCQICEVSEAMQVHISVWHIENVTFKWNVTTSSNQNMTLAFILRIKPQNKHNSHIHICD